MEEKMTPWIEFPDNRAIARRLVSVTGANGLLIATSRTPDGARVAELARASRFAEVRDGLFYMSFKDINKGYSVSEIAERLGATRITVPISRVVRELTVGSGAPAKPEPSSSPSPVTEPQVPASESSDAASPREPAPEAPAAPAVQTAPKAAPAARAPKKNKTFDLSGVRHDVIFSGRKGLLIARDADGVRYAGLSVKTMMREPEGQRSMAFLRATGIDDADKAAEIVIKDALTTRRNWNATMLSELVRSMTEGSDLDSLAMLEKVREAMISRTVDIGVADNASQDSLAQAMLLSDMIGGGVARDSDVKLNPSLPLMVIMRRIMRGSDVSEVYGSPDLSLAMAGAVTGPASSVIDLAGEDRLAWNAFVSGALARRDAKGRSVIILPLAGDSEEVGDIRDTISMSYGIEGTLGMTSVVADGAAGNDRWTAIFVGSRRAEPLPMPPAASQRLFEAVTPHELRSFEADVLRSRRKISEFEAGISEDARKTNDRESNEIQVPTVNMARKPAFTMTPYGLSGSVQKAQSRVLEAAAPFGSVEAFVGSRMGFAISEVEDTFSGEQVDAIATMVVAQDRGRSFLIADDAGVGKTRPACAAVRMHLRAGAMDGERRKAVYFVEKNANIADVMENLEIMGVDLKRVGMMSTMSSYTQEVQDEDGVSVRFEHLPVPAKKRREIFESGAFPEEYDVLIAPYSMFNQRPSAKVRNGQRVAPSSWWASNAVDANTLLVIDEAHNSVKPGSNTGANLRAMERGTVPENIVKLSATPLRDIAGVSYYESLLPEDMPNRSGIITALRSGGDVELESFMSMLVEDGVMIRRAQDVSAAKISSVFPDAETLRDNIEHHRAFSPVIQEIVAAAASVGDIASDIRASRVRERAVREGARGWDEYDQAHRAMLIENSSDSRAIGTPIDIINRMLEVAVKVDMAVDIIVKKFREEGQRPLISFDRTFGALLGELMRDENGEIDQNVFDREIRIDMTSQIRRIADKTFIRRIEGVATDLRLQHAGLADMSRNLNMMIENLPKIFSASPIDRILERLRSEGIVFGEVSGRSLRYDEEAGRILRRPPAEKNGSAEIIRKFQSGEIDGVAYNASGATGINLEDSERFPEAGRGQRMTVVLDPFVDVVRFVQGANRTKRYLQLTNPEITILHSGLPYGEYNAQMLNRNLHMIASSIDGTREHPLLIGDVPDMFNAVGDRAAMNILAKHPEIARSTGLEHMVSKRNDPAPAEDADDDDAGPDPDEFIDHGIDGDDNSIKGLAKRFLQRLTSLEYEQSIAIRNETVEEYQVLKEAAAAINQDPTKPQMLDGIIIKTSTGIFSGKKVEGTSGSAFESPVLISSGYQEVPEDKINGEMLMTMIAKERRAYGADIGQKLAASVERNMRGVISHHFRPINGEITLDQAMARPDLGGKTFEEAHDRVTKVAGFLKRVSQGSQIRMRCRFDFEKEESDFVITSIVQKDKIGGYPSSYVVEYCAPGDWTPRVATLASLMRTNDIDEIIVTDGLSRAPDRGILETFNREADGVWKRPVQILDGNLLSALDIARRHKLGKPTLFKVRDEEGNEKIERGIVVMTNKIDLDYLPRQVMDEDLFAHVWKSHVNRLSEGKDERFDGIIRFWSSFDQKKETSYADASHFLRFFHDRALVEIPAPSKGSWDFYAERPGLHEALYGEPLAAREAMKRAGNKKGRGKDDFGVTIPIDSKESLERIATVFRLLSQDGESDPGLTFYVSGSQGASIASFGETGTAARLYGEDDLPDVSPDSKGGYGVVVPEEPDAVGHPDFDDEEDPVETEDMDEDVGEIIDRAAEPAGAFDIDDEPETEAMDIEGIEL